jgi:hypothetical protein
MSSVTGAFGLVAWGGAHVSIRSRSSTAHVPKDGDLATKRALMTLNEEDDREFRDFIESVSVTQEELAAMVRTLELSSIHEVREYLRVSAKGKQNSPTKMTAPLALKEFQRRLQRGWGRVAAAFVAAGAQYYQPRSLRKS